MPANQLTDYMELLQQLSRQDSTIHAHFCGLKSGMFKSREAMLVSLSCSLAKEKEAYMQESTVAAFSIKKEATQ